MSKKPKIVLYEPQQVNQELGQYTSYDILPLEMLAIASLPDAEGYEVVVLDASLYSHAEAHKRAVEACEGALIFATTSILGYMVADGHLAAMAVKAAHPEVKIITGGWFPSTLPESFLCTGIYDAVCLGQGEITFRDFVHAVESGAPLEQVPGLALWRDGKVVETERRTIVGWGELKRAAWHLIDIEPYRERQLRPGARQARNRMPSPPHAKGSNYFAISHFSSFGCPEPCTFCCSPIVTLQRWKAMPADRLLDDLQDLQQRWGFSTVRFMDANWGVHEKRAADFSRGLIEREMKLSWSATIEVHSILRSKKENLDLLRDSGFYVAQVGAESANPQILESIGKQIKPGDTKLAARELHDRGIVTSLTYIMGYPYETAESMLSTLDEARDIVSSYPSVSAHVYPFRPIPGNELYKSTLDLGYIPPKTVLEWGSQLEYHVMETWKGHIPEDVQRVWRLYYQYSSFVHGLVRPKRGLMEKVSEWRLRTGNYAFPVELRAFYLLDRVFGWRAHKEDEKQTWIMSSENESVVMAK